MRIDFWDEANLQFDLLAVIKSHSMRYSLVTIIDKSNFFVFKVGPIVFCCCGVNKCIKNKF